MYTYKADFTGGIVVKNLPNIEDTGDPRSGPGLGRSPGGGYGNPLRLGNRPWEIPQTSETAGLQPTGPQRVRHH